MAYDIYITVTKPDFFEGGEIELDAFFEMERVEGIDREFADAYEAMYGSLEGLLETDRKAISGMFIRAGFAENVEGVFKFTSEEQCTREDMEALLGSFNTQKELIEYLNTARIKPKTSGLTVQTK